MSKEADISLLQQYLAKEIDAKEVLSVDGTPLSEEELASAVLEYESTVAALEGAGLKKHLQDIHESIVPMDQKTSRTNWLAIAASIVLMAVFGTLIWQSMNREAEFSDYFNHFDQLVTYRDSDSTSYSAGLEAYELRNYNKAYTLLANIDGLSNELKFYQAVSALGSKRYNEAIALFEFIGTEPSNKYYQQTKWYLGLSYWQVGKIDKAILVLKGISDGQYKEKEALELQKKLSK